MNRVDREPIFILHSLPYRNTSLIVDCLSMHGRFSALARSARGLKSRYRGMLQLFSPLLASWSGNRELKNLGVVERYGPIYQLEGKALVCGFYLNELLQRLLQRDDPHPEIYTLYQNTLDVLAGEQESRPALRLFEKNLLKFLGYGMPLGHDAQTHEAIVETAYYQYVPERGFLRCYEDPNNHDVFSGKTLIALEDESLTSELVLKESRRLLTLVLDRYLGGRPIKSRELLVVNSPYNLPVN